jgi:two-component system OmpR family sensor kinase
MRRALVPILAALLGLAGSLGATVSLQRAARASLGRAFEARLRGAGETAALTLGRTRPDPVHLAALVAANDLDGAYLLDRSLVVLADTAGPAGARADLLRVDAARVERAFAGEASVAPSYALGELEVATGYFPVRSGDGTVAAVLALEAGESFGAARAGLERALVLGAGLSLASALALAVAAARFARSERLRREAAARAARGDAVAAMAAVAAHEIRTPLGIIRGSIELMRERAGPALGERDHQALADVLGEVERLRRLTEDLLDLAADRPLALAPTDVGEVLAEAAQAWRAVHPSATVRLDVSGVPRVKGDPGRLRQVVVNLLDNAAQAGAGTIEVRAAARAGEVLVAVRDDGPGIPSEIRQRLFEPFVTGRAGGTGLGLAICRRLVERHGGTLGLAAGGAGGATFEMRLPALPG